jgi:guanylate kinase
MKIILKHKAEFQKLLADYAPATDAQEILSKIPLVIFMGVSGSGRNTIINHLVETGKYKFVVSDTTRPPKVRDGALEENAVHYYFRSEEDVLADLNAGKFLEAELIHNQQISGISIRELVEVSKSGKIPINEVEFGGALNILKIKPDAKIFFVVPPSYSEWMRRLTAREQMSTEELHNRIRTAIKVIQIGLKEDRLTFVINDSSLESAEMVDHLVRGGEAEEHHNEARQIAKGILEDIRKHYDV